MYASLADSLASQHDWVPEPHQILPAGDWLYGLLVAGRGAGKTDAGAHYVDLHARGPACLPGDIPHRIAVAAPTLSDARLTCVKGDSGLQAHNPAIRFTHSDGELFWPNGARGRIFGAFTPEDVERWRGPQHCLIWADELAAWRLLSECWDQMRLGLRLGTRPRVIATSTPKPLKWLKELMADPRSVVVKARTHDNPYLHPDVVAELDRRFGGSRLGRQELEGELLDDMEGAYWRRQELDKHRVATVPTSLYRKVTAVDPAITHGDASDATAVVTAGMSDPATACPACGGEGPHFFVLQSDAYRLSPAGWATRAIDHFDAQGAGLMIVENNQGGEMVMATLHQVRRDLPLRTVTAVKGKADRAMEISILYEQGRVHHVGAHDALEDEMCVFPVAAEHDDLVDACVYALLHLKERRGKLVLGVNSLERVWQ